MTMPKSAIGPHGEIIIMDKSSVRSGVPVVSIIIPTIENDIHLKACIESVFSTTENLFVEVIVVDDSGKTDHNLYFKNVKVVKNDSNLGFALACNRGAEFASGRYLLFLNSDTFVFDGWLQEMLKSSGNMMAGIVGSKLTYFGTDRVQHNGMKWSKASKSYVLDGKGLRTAEIKSDKHVEAVCGACMLVDKMTWISLGGFDERFEKGYFEDVDLCLRWIEMGGRVSTCSKSNVWHHEMGTFGKLKWQEILQNSREVFDKIWSKTRRENCFVRYPFVPSVDIIIAVFNACSSAVKCIESIQSETPKWLDAKITIVDDCSDRYTSEKLIEMLLKFENVNVIKTEKNSGYLPAINLATEKTNAPWICYVNSDVVVTDGWITKMIFAAEMNENVAIVNPFTNNAAHLSIQYPFGSNFQDVSEKISSCSERRNFEIVTPVGFCMLVWRQALNEVGGYDVDYYGKGYGEECDLYMRLEEAGYKSIMADDAFVYHEGGQTFSQIGKQKEFEFAGYTKFMKRWKTKIEPKLKKFNRESPQFYIRKLLDKQKTDRPEVVFVFREVSLCGGVLAVVRICNRLNELGWNASFACTQAKLSDLKKMGLRFTPYIFKDKNDLVRGLSKILTKGASVVATIWITTNEVVEIEKRRSDIVSHYFMQDAEYRFCFPNGTPYVAKEKVVETYNSIERKVINSDWVVEDAKSLGMVGKIKKIGIGVDTNMFYPEEKKESLNVLVHCRPSTPRRGWKFISEVLKKVQAVKSDFTITTYDQPPVGLSGCDHKGQVTSQELAKLMRQASVFFEGSKYQGWGMQALEAMSTGLALVSTLNQGIDNYGTDGYDFCGVLYGDVEGAAKTVLDFLNDADARKWYGLNARASAENFDWKYIGDEWNRYLKGEMKC